LSNFGKFNAIVPGDSVNYLQERISNKQARIGVIGLGYVGLPLAIEFVKAGFNVTGIDNNQEKVNSLNDGKNYIKDVDDNELKKMINNGNFLATADFGKLSDLDCVIICVPTPLNKLKDPDISHVLEVLNFLKTHIHKNMLISLESTTYPGTTRELLLPELESSGLIVGDDFYLCYSPERIDPGNPTYKINNTPKVIGGVTINCTEIASLFYGQIIDQPIEVSSPEAAELSKILENTYRSINIGLANEVAIMCEKLGVDVWEVIEAAASKPFGFMKFKPGPGLGGHCIPVDPHYLSWKMKSLDYQARFIQLAGDINTAMPAHVRDLIALGLNYIEKSINSSKILVLGVAYKPDIDDTRESPALDVIQLLETDGAQVDYYDPFADHIEWEGTSKNSLENIDEKTLRGYDLVALITNHSTFDYDMIKRGSKLIVDTRNAFDNSDAPHIIKLGTGNHKIQPNV
jgi:UDP-N-acetyl-D-glucosamine dehydrogenase